MGSAPDAKVLVLRPEVYYQYSKETWLSIDGVDRVEENYLMDPNYEFILMSEEDYVRNVVNGIWQEAIDNSNNS